MKSLNINYKSWRIIFISLIAICFVRCETLDETPMSFIAPENFFETIPQCETALAAAMSRLWNEWFDGSYGYGYGYFRHDDQIAGGGLNISPNHADKLWRSHFFALLNINAVLKAVKSGKVEGTPANINQLKAQATFLRAFNYFRLVQMFGALPLYTEENEDPAVNPIARSPIEDVYGLIINDLEFSVQNLPVQWPADKMGRMTKYTAQGMLAKVYLVMATAPLNATENYAKARDAAKAVINASDNPYFLHQDVHDVFKKENKYLTEIMFSFNSNTEDWTTSANIWGPGEIGGWGDYKADPKIDTIWPQQPRKDAYLLTELVPGYGGYSGDTLHYTQWRQQIPSCKKYMMPYITIEEWKQYKTTANFPILRFAEMYLIFAEAENMSNGGPNQEAVNAINVIIDRANGWQENPDYPRLTTSMSKEEFDRAVIRERYFELCFEYDRYFDLVRKKMLGEVNPNHIQDYSEDDYLFPIPQEDLKANPLLTQNPGYPTP
jgi:starch-binding outer membrane protein, SusD/RagB family